MKNVQEAEIEKIGEAETNRTEIESTIKIMAEEIMIEVGVLLENKIITPTMEEISKEKMIIINMNLIERKQITLSQAVALIML